MQSDYIAFRISPAANYNWDTHFNYMYIIYNCKKTFSKISAQIHDVSHEASALLWGNVLHVVQMQSYNCVTTPSQLSLPRLELYWQYSHPRTSRFSGRYNFSPSYCTRGNVLLKFKFWSNKTDINYRRSPPYSHEVEKVNFSIHTPSFPPVIISVHSEKCCIVEDSMCSLHILCTVFTSCKLCFAPHST